MKYLFLATALLSWLPVHAQSSDTEQQASKAYQAAIQLSILSAQYASLANTSCANTLENTPRVAQLQNRIVRGLSGTEREKIQQYYQSDTYQADGANLIIDGPEGLLEAMKNRGQTHKQLCESIVSTVDSEYRRVFSQWLRVEK